jgi:hypothetical protein
MILPTGQWQSGTIALGTRVRRELMIRRQFVSSDLMHSFSVMQTNGICVSSL